MTRRELLQALTSATTGALFLRLTACSEDATFQGGVAPGLRRSPGRSGTLTIDGSTEDGDASAADEDAGIDVDAAATDPDATGIDDASSADAGDGATDAGFVVLYDTYAQALYYDGTFGPKTGIIRVADVMAGQEVTFDFWHGHNGRKHRYTLKPEHFRALKRLERVTLETTMGDNHSHKLFVDPVDPRWRVPGAPPVAVPL